MGREGRNAPARDGRGRQARQLLLGDRPPTPQRQRRHARVLSGQLQAAGCGEAEARDLADDGGKPPLPQSLLHDGQHVALTKGLGIDDAIRMQARIHKARREEIAAAETPEHRAFEPRRDAGDEEGGGTGELRRRARLDHLVQGAEGEPALRQPFIDDRKSEGQRAAAVPPAVQALDPVPQIGKHPLLPDTHAPCPSPVIFRDVLIMFASDAESI